MAWTNWKELRGVFSKERIFLWKVEDMLLIGSRIHRPNSDMIYHVLITYIVCYTEFNLMYILKRS